MDNQFTYEYLPWRNISLSTFRLYDVKTKVNAEGKPVSVGFPYVNGTFKVRLLERKDFYAVGDIASAGLFGKDKFSSGSHKYVTITEGEFDALALHEVCGSPVVSVQSAGTACRDCVQDYEWLSGFERIYLAFDADEPGRKALREVARLFDPLKVYHVRFSKHKDANAYLMHGDQDELRNVWWNSKPYVPDNVINSFEEFEKVLFEPDRPSIPYPFPTLNDLTYGIRTGESVLITALEGVGKTELMHAIEFQILQETQDNVGAIFLEEPKRRHLQALAGLWLKSPVHLPDSVYGADAVAEALRKTVVADQRLHLYSHFGSDDPSVLLDTIRFLVSGRGCRYILLDHITMAVSGLAGDDERRALDQLSTQLEMLVKELDFALIMVSHVNDEGLTRGSRYISKIADIRIDLKRDLKEIDPNKRNLSTLEVSKNRFSGRTGPAGILRFDPNTFTYSELPRFDNDDLLLTEHVA